MATPHPRSSATNHIPETNNVFLLKFKRKIIDGLNMPIDRSE